MSGRKETWMSFSVRDINGDRRVAVQNCPCFGLYKGSRVGCYASQRAESSRVSEGSEALSAKSERKKNSGKKESGP